MPATIVISALLLAAVAAIVRSMARRRKSGQCACSCGCSGCPSAGMCHGGK